MKHTANTYRRIFRKVSANMPNWKEQIIVCIDSDDMRGTSDAERISRAVRYMGLIKLSVEFMVGGPSIVKMYDNADSTGKTIVLRNAGYYSNIGA